VPTNGRFPVTEDELRLAAWIGQEVPPDRGAVGLAAWTFTAAAHGVEHHVYPLGGGHALPLYGAHYNFRFLLPGLEGDRGWTAYREHVGDDIPLPALAAGAAALGGTPEGPAPLLAAAALLPGRSHAFDAEWCLANDIRYFYATPAGLAENPALAWAVAQGRLRPVVKFGHSVLYEVVP
jgi:hypothetical protein